MADLLNSGSDRPPKRWVTVLAALVLVAGVVAYAATRNSGSPHPSAQQSPTPSGIGGWTATAEPAPATPTVTDVGHPLLGITAGWELFGRGDDDVVRIQLAAGRVTRTPVPTLSSTGPVSFLAGPQVALVRPLDYVSGFMVPDGHGSRPLTGVLGEGGPILPGPDAEHIWAEVNDTQHTAMSLFGWDGRPGHGTVALPPDLAQIAEPDGAGYLLLSGTGGVYDARPAGLRRVTTGAVLASGPTRWLTWECDDQARCHAVVIDRASGARRTLPKFASGNLTTADVQGVISPDGSIAALQPTDTGGASWVHLISLATGNDRRLSVPPDQNARGGQGMLFSPDGRWLFVIGASGRLFAVDVRTGASHDLGVKLPPLDQLAIRD